MKLPARQIFTLTPYLSGPHTKCGGYKDDLFKTNLLTETHLLKNTKSKIYSDEHCTTVIPSTTTKRVRFNISLLIIQKHIYTPSSNIHLEDKRLTGSLVSVAQYLSLLTNILLRTKI